MNRIEQLLRDEIGLDAASVGPTAIERAARLRMKSLGISAPGDYQRLLESSRSEREELIESVIVPETWFFRDRECFTAFLELAQQWLYRNQSGPLRILSIPCSSGEEPYSLAMGLLDACVPRERFVIDAVDISARMLARAIRAVYGKNSFRGKELSFRDRHFRKTNEGFVLHSIIRESVNFHQDNLLNFAFLAGHEPYDFIFCRNLLIYFDGEVQAKSVARLHSRLTPDGLVLVSPAEVSIFLENGFVSADIPLASACRKANGALTLRSENFGRIRQSSTAADSSPLRPPPLDRKTGANSSADGESNGAPEATLANGDLEQAQKMADAGKIHEAMEICQTHLSEHGPSARVFYLLGLVHDAAGDAQAADDYRKALYLEPDHQETLWHLALLLEKNGQNDEARALRRRAKRAQTKLQT